MQVPPSAGRQRGLAHDVGVGPRVGRRPGQQRGERPLPGRDTPGTLGTPGTPTVCVVVAAGAGVAPGEGALAALLSRSAADPRAYAYVVGESALATGGRRHLHAAGLPKNRITFSGYWKR